MSDMQKFKSLRYEPSSVGPEGNTEGIRVEWAAQIIVTARIEGNLAHTKQPLPRKLQQAHA